MSNYRLQMAVAALLGAAMSTAHAADPKAASANPTFANPDTPGLLEGKPAPDAANVTDVVFLKQIAIGGKAEVDLGKLAVDRNAAAGVETFAQRMVKDHGKANDELATIAAGKGIDAPKRLDAEHQAMIDSMQQKSGHDFDTEYSRHMNMDHSKAVALFESATKSPDADLAGFASKTLPTLKEHRQLAKTLPTK